MWVPPLLMAIKVSPAGGVDWPCSSCPQQTGVPSARSAHVCKSPLLMAMKPSLAVFAGSAEGVRVLVGSGAAVSEGPGVVVAACSARGVGASVDSGGPVGTCRSTAHAVSNAHRQQTQQPSAA